MKTDVQRISWSNWIFGLFVVFLLVLSAVLFSRIRAQSEASSWVDHSYQVKLKLQEVFTELREAEAGQRGFLVSRDSLFLDQFNLSRQAIPVIVKQLDSLIRDDDEVQEKNLRTLDSLISIRVAWMSMVVDTVTTTGSSDVFRNLVLKGQQISRPGVQIDVMKAREDGILQARLADKAHKETLAAVFIVIFSLFSLSILVFSFLRLKKELTRTLRLQINTEVLAQKVRQRTTELEQANERLNAQNRELEQKNQELNSFTYIASHDLKEPLRKISIFSDLILTQEKFSDSGLRYFSRVTDSIQKMDTLIESVFSYARVQGADDFENTDLNVIANRVIETLDEPIKEKQGRVVVSYLPVLNAIPQQMEQLFMNMITNALKYSRLGVAPELVINAKPGTGRSGEGWVITFTDNGIGFETQYREKIFEIFSRLHSSKEYSGTGIGLAICKKVAENHHGTISAESIPGQGSVFSLYLPLKPSQTAESGRKQKREEKSHS